MATLKLVICSTVIFNRCYRCQQEIIANRECRPAEGDVKTTALLSMENADAISEVILRFFALHPHEAYCDSVLEDRHAQCVPTANTSRLGLGNNSNSCEESIRLVLYMKHNYLGLGCFDTRLRPVFRIVFHGNEVTRLCDAMRILRRQTSRSMKSGSYVKSTKTFMLVLLSFPLSYRYTEF